MTPGLRRGLIEIGAAGADIEDWWIIGSAAMALWGFDIEPHDIDVFGPEPVMRRLLNHWGMASGAHSANDRFRSTPYTTVRLLGCPDIELMGDLEVNGTAGWRPVSLGTRTAFDLEGARLFAPDLPELASLFRAFGRPKDLNKAASCEARLFKGSSSRPHR